MATPFTYQIPADITQGPVDPHGTVFLANVTSIEDLVKAVREVQSRIQTWNAANPTNPI